MNWAKTSLCRFNFNNMCINYKALDIEQSLLSQFVCKSDSFTTRKNIYECGERLSIICLPGIIANRQ